MRSDKRPSDQLRHINITPDYLEHAEGSVLIEAGRTRVICTASVEDRVPPQSRRPRAAERAREDASYAVDYAYAAIEEALYAVLDADLAHRRADELAQA